jgi:flagellar biosynthesis anti-sigma factor FlgM
MKSVNLNGINSTQQARLQQSEPVRPKDGETPLPSLAHSTPDQVSVSSRAEEAGRLIARAGELGDIRHERVDSLREAIQSDQYHVSSSTIADAIIRDEGA